jgi:beta-lactamase class A
MIRWSVCVRELRGGVVFADRAQERLSTASLGKVFLLLEVARRFADGSLRRDEPLCRTPALAVADSGLWQHLRTDCLPAEDLAVLVAAVSDNLATNVLLERVGLAEVQRLARELGYRSSALHDRVRDDRSAADEPVLSSGTAAELSRLMVEVARDERVAGWLARNTDLSMVASAFDLDPLAHADPTGTDAGLTFFNKTGTDAGVRADAGVLRGPAASLAYAVVANWPGDGEDRRHEVLCAMREIGEWLLSRCCGTRRATPS